MMDKQTLRRLIAQHVPYDPKVSSWVVADRIVKSIRDGK
jgi:hypothetical protein